MKMCSMAIGERPFSRRNGTIDSLRGLLILLVFVGHSFLVPVTQDPWKWLIYGFHMPVFMALSAYMLNVEGIRALSPRELAVKYGARLMIPWLLAMVIYTALYTDLDSAKAAASAVLYPYYHLWYVPVLMAYIVLLYLVRLPVIVLAAIAAVISIAAMAVFGQGTWQGLDFEGAGAVIVRALGDKRLYSMAIFFAFGLVLRRYRDHLGSSHLAIGLVVIAAVAATVYQGLFYVDQPAALILTFVALDFSLSALFPYLFSRPSASLPVIDQLGFDSLFFYLWHPLLFLTARQFLYPLVPVPVAMTATVFGSIAILFAVRSLLSRWRLLAFWAGLQPARNSARGLQPVGGTGAAGG